MGLGSCRHTRCTRVHPPRPRKKLRVRKKRTRVCLYHFFERVNVLFFRDFKKESPAAACGKQGTFSLCVCASTVQINYQIPSCIHSRSLSLFAHFLFLTLSQIQGFRQRPSRSVNETVIPLGTGACFGGTHRPCDSQWRPTLAELTCI